MSYFFNLNNCRRLTLITSESCNLNCSYCLMAKTTNKNKHLETENIKKSFNDGTYFNNIQQIFLKYNIDPQKIYSMELWGQEPTLTLNEFSNSFKDFYTFLPNLHSLFFSTNAIAFPERIINLITIINKIITKPFELRIQFSYDGYSVTKESRGIDPDIIISNISTIITELNKIKINDLFKVKFNFHNVLSANIFNKYGSENANNNEFYNYLKELSDLGFYFEALNTNNKIYIDKSFGCGIENPYNATKEEGQNFANFFKKAKIIGRDIEEHWWERTIEYFNNSKIQFPEKYNYSLNFYANLKKLNKQQFNPVGCQTCHSGITIRYDGTIIYCQNALTYLKPSDYPNNQDLNFKLQKELVSKNYYPNLLKEENKTTIEKNFYRHQNFIDSFTFSITEVINLLYLLLNANQIDESYKNNEEKILRHAMLINSAVCCPEANLNITGSLYGQDIGKIRLLCNGFLDIMDEYYNERINNNEK